MDEEAFMYLIREFQKRADELRDHIADGGCSDFCACKAKVAERKEALAGAERIRDLVKKYNQGA